MLSELDGLNAATGDVGSAAATGIDGITGATSSTSGTNDIDGAIGSACAKDDDLGEKIVKAHKQEKNN